MTTDKTQVRVEGQPVRDFLEKKREASLAKKARETRREDVRSTSRNNPDPQGDPTMESNRPIYIVELIDTKGWDWTYDHFYGPEKRVHLGAAEADAVAARLNTGDFNVWVDMDNDRFLEAEEKPVYRVIEIALGKLRALVEELRRCGRGYCEIEPGFYYDASESDLEKAEKLALQREV